MAAIAMVDANIIVVVVYVVVFVFVKRIFLNNVVSATVIGNFITAYYITCSAWQRQDVILSHTRI